MPPRRTSATIRVVAAARAAAAAAAAPMAPVAGDGSHNSETGIRGTIRTLRDCTCKDFLNCKPLTFKGTKGVVVLSQWFEKMELVFHISNCAVENQVKFATCTFLGNALTWWNSHMKTVTQDVAYAMDWKAIKKMMTAKYCLKDEIKKCGRMFHEESDEVEKYVGGLFDMIRGNKRKLEFNAGNNQGHQQQNKRQNTGRAYTAGPGEKREYTGSFPLCTKCIYHHKGPCAPRCNKCKKISHLARDCRSSGPNGNNNNRGNSERTQNDVTCYECGVQGHFKKDYVRNIVFIVTTDTVMSSDSASSEVTYTSISSHEDPLAWAMDFFGLHELDSPEAAPASPDYKYPEYLAPSDEEVPVDDQPYVVADSPIALSPGYVADSDPEEDSEDGLVDYPADGGDGYDDDSSNNDEEEEEEHLAPVDSVIAPVVDLVPSFEETKLF
ncbi:hypothetical protein Tco_0942172 [Tanacetum coccineum]